MNAPVPKFMIESTWRGRLFGSEWRAAEGGSIDVVEPATGAAITSVGNAGAKDVRRAAAEVMDRTARSHAFVRAIGYGFCLSVAR